MKRHTLLAIFLSAAFLIPTEGPAEAKRMKRHTIDTLNFRVYVPKTWKTAALDELDASATWTIDKHGGRLTVYHLPDNRDLKGIQSDLKIEAKMRDWKIVKTRRAKVRGNKALAMTLDIPGDGVTSRQMFYFFNTKHGRYILQFGTAKKRFKKRLFRKIAARFRPLKPKAKTPSVETAKTDATPTQSDS